MKAETAEKLSKALESISDHFQAIEHSKSEKTIAQTVSDIQDARIALLKESLES